MGGDPTSPAGLPGIVAPLHAKRYGDARGDWNDGNRRSRHLAWHPLVSLESPSDGGTEQRTARGTDCGYRAGMAVSVNVAVVVSSRHDQAGHDAHGRADHGAAAH